MNKYLEEARRFYQEAEVELEKGKQESNLIKIRDASEKAWNAMVQVTDALFANKGMPIPESHFERRKGLVELTLTDPSLDGLGLRDRLMARNQILHQGCFYEGYCPIPLLDDEFSKVKKYIEDIERLVC